jgi:hypothetical protein
VSRLGESVHSGAMTNRSSNCSANCALAASLGVLFLAGCGVLSRAHAERVQSQLTCGLTILEVERAVGGPLHAQEARDPRVTHLFRDGFTDLWLVFDNGGLRSSQISHVVGFTGTRESPRIDHCKG